MSFKLNQVTEAISQLAGQSQAKSRVEIKLKRLMEVDRNFDRTQWAGLARETRPAFFSAEKPGKGVEILFSGYEAFALYLGWMFLEQGQPQSDAVMIMRRARKRLEAKHAEILRCDTRRLSKKGGALARAGSLAGGEQSTFLVVDRTKSPDGRPKNRLIEIVDEPMAFIAAQEPGFSATIIELGKNAHHFHRALNRTVASKRGRRSS